MIRAAVISGAAGSRRVEAEGFPLAVGGEPAAVACPGVAADTVLAFIGLSRGHPFLQPAAPDAPLTLNGEALTESAWIRDGDRIAAGAAQVRVTVRADVLALTVAAAASKDLVPPPSPPPGPAGESSQIGTAQDPPQPGRAQDPPDPDRAPEPPRIGTAQEPPQPGRAQDSSQPGRAPEPSQPGRSQEPPQPGRAEEPSQPGRAQESSQPGRAQESSQPGRAQESPHPDRAPEPPHPGREQEPGQAGRVQEPPHSGPAREEAHGPGAPPPDEPAAAAPRIELRPRRRGPRTLSLALLGVFCLLLVAAAFVFLSTAATIRVAPAPDTLSLAGPFPHLQVRGRYLLLPGDYRLRAAKAGYHDLEQLLEVQRGRHLDLSFRLAKLPGLVSVTTRPATGVRVSVDGAPLGESPLAELRLEAGAHTLSAEAERYLPAQRELEVEGLGRRQSVEIALSPRWASVAFASDPQGAEVWMGGELRGVTPLSLDLLDGDHEAELRKTGYQSASVSFTVEPGVPLALPAVQLAEALARVTVDSVPQGASVTVDGSFAGRTPLALSLTPRDAHTLDVSRAGYAPLTRTLELAPAEERALDLRLAALLGVVFVTVDPADAELVVDGKALGAATGRHELTATEHAIEIRRSGYQPHRAALTPRPGVSQRLDVTLEPVDRAPPGALRTGEGQELVLVAPGSVRMGASRREPGRRANEPLRRAVLKRPFFFARNEVTNAEFRRFDARHSSGSTGGVSLGADAAPVAGVTWEQAARYLNWLSLADGLPPAYEERGEAVVAIRPPTTGYRLPTEAEWAYVARRAGRGGEVKYPWSGAFPPSGRAGNYADESARDVLADVIAGYDDGHAASAPVGRFDANPLGIHDLGGNVAEWCHDVYSPAGDADGAVDPLGPENGRHHVVRGSSWRHASISELRLSFRDYSDKARSDLGFRIVRYAR